MCLFSPSWKSPDSMNFSCRTSCICKKSTQRENSLRGRLDGKSLKSICKHICWVFSHTKCVHVCVGYVFLINSYYIMCISRVCDLYVDSAAARSEIMRSHRAFLPRCLLASFNSLPSSPALAFTAAPVFVSSSGCVHTECVVIRHQTPHCTAFTTWVCI